MTIPGRINSGPDFFISTRKQSYQVKFCDLQPVCAFGMLTYTNIKNRGKREIFTLQRVNRGSLVSFLVWVPCNSLLYHALTSNFCLCDVFACCPCTDIPKHKTLSQRKKRRHSTKGQATSSLCCVKAFRLCARCRSIGEDTLLLYRVKAAQSAQAGPIGKGTFTFYLAKATGHPPLHPSEV